MQYEIAPLTKIQTTLHLVWLKNLWAQMQIGILKPNDKKNVEQAGNINQIVFIRNKPTILRL